LRIAPKSFAFTALLGLFAALPALSIDISAPTLPLLPQALGTSRTVAGLTLSLFMIGFALGQFGGGSLSDGYGRRPVLLGGLTNFTLAGIACSLAQSGDTLAIARLIQGFGAGVCSVISFAMVQDLFEGDAARAKRSYVTVIFGGVPILAPALGSVLLDWFGWRSVHGVLAIAGALLLAVTWVGVAESKLTGGDVPAETIENAAVPLWRDSGFIGIALANALSYGAIFAYIAGSPVVVMAQMGRSAAVFAGVFACTATALAAGAWTSGRLSRRGAGAVALVNPSLMAAAAAAIALAIVSLSGISSGAFLIPLLLILMFTRGIIAPNLQHLAIERQRERAGVASAAVGVSQLLSGALASGLVAILLQSFGQSAVAVPIALLAVGALITWRRTAL
jgi:DHA1 family bicyclomycin/chloramphenicol resistance-like MFS transporter